MKLTVLVKSKSNKEMVTEINEHELVVSTRAIPVKGLANKSVIKAVADHFGVAKSMVKILAGHTSRKKIIEIIENN